jgi:hypothetical protein
MGADARYLELSERIPRLSLKPDYFETKKDI